MKQAGKTEAVKEAVNPSEPAFRVAVTPYEREGSNILGLGHIYFEDSFVVNNVSILKGKEKEFVAMPSYLAKQKGKDGKPQYQDVCFPVTKEFREKLYQEIMDCYHREKDRNKNSKDLERTNHRVKNTEEQRNNPVQFR